MINKSHSCPAFDSRLLTPLLLILLLIPLMQAEAQSEEEAVLHVVQQFFDVLAEKDTALARTILLPECHSHSIRVKPEGSEVRSHHLLDFMKDLPDQKNRFKEIMHNPKVMIHKQLAVVWTSYNFHVNGEYSHKGVDAFNLLKTDSGWKIASIVYTVEK